MRVALYESGLFVEPVAAEGEEEVAPQSNLDAVALPGFEIPSAADLLIQFPYHAAELPNVLRLCYLAQNGSGADVLNFVEWAKANGDPLPTAE